MMVSRFGSSGDASFCDFQDGVDVIKWKLYGKNKAFNIMQDAACKIQAFWRGCIARAATTKKIQRLIDDITAFRKLEAEYRKRDAEDRRNYELERNTSDNSSEQDVPAKSVCRLLAQSGLSCRRKKSKPWRISTQDSGSEERIVNVVTPTRKTTKITDTLGAEFRVSDDRYLIRSVEDDTRGYRRYRRNIHGKNKSRPWRDDTNVFDAF